MSCPCGLKPCRCKEIYQAFKDGATVEGLRDDYGHDLYDLVCLLVSESRKEAWREACEAVLNECLQLAPYSRKIIRALSERGPEE